MKIRAVIANNRKKAFEVTLSDDRTLPYPFAKLDRAPGRSDALEEVFVDPELADEGFTARFASGQESTVHLDQVLDYNRDPDYLRDLTVYELTLQARESVERSDLSKREIIRRLNTSATQFYRLLDPTNYKKSIGQLIALLEILDRDVELVVRDRPDNHLGGGEPLRQARFRIREAFPASSELARVMVTLAMPTNDLLQVFPVFVDSLQREGEAEKGRQIYWFRLVSGHLREALTRLQEAQTKASFREFVAEIPAQGQDALRQLEPYYEPWAGSFLQRVLKPLRDGAFHYVAEDSVEALLKAIQDESTEIVTGRRVRDMRLVIADDVAAQQWIHEIESTGDTMFEAIATSRRVVDLFLRAMNHLVSAYTRDFVLPYADVTEIVGDPELGGEPRRSA